MQQPASSQVAGPHALPVVVVDVVVVGRGSDGGSVSSSRSNVINVNVSIIENINVKEYRSVDNENMVTIYSLLLS